MVHLKYLTYHFFADNFNITLRTISSDFIENLLRICLKNLQECCKQTRFKFLIVNILYIDFCLHTMSSCLNYILIEFQIIATYNWLPFSLDSSVGNVKKENE